MVGRSELEAHDLNTVGTGSLRNIAAHMSMAFHTGEVPFKVVPNFLDKPSRVARVEKMADLMRVLKSPKGDLFQLGMYVHGLFCFMAYPGDKDPMPRRPRLKALSVERQAKTP